uniref:Uncharacterized protein n=1 Tax=Octopus bimaculoides TaxID=37653 RepID=A0A0L8HS54_OCTBM
MIVLFLYLLLSLKGNRVHGGLEDIQFYSQMIAIKISKFFLVPSPPFYLFSVHISLQTPSLTLILPYTCSWFVICAVFLVCTYTVYLSLFIIFDVI